MKTFKILKRNRKYFSAQLESGRPCKLLIDANSESLELGDHTLEVDDISVRSKYGTDLIFKLNAPAQSIASAGICSLKTPTYNALLVEQCHRLGGKWDADEKAWIFSGLVANEVELLDEKYNSELLNIEITFNESVSAHCSGVTLAGFRVASASGRDSGAKLASGIALISGDIGSGGSYKNWKTVIKEGAVIRMQIPMDCIEDIEHPVTIINLDTGQPLLDDPIKNTVVEVKSSFDENPVDENKAFMQLAIEKLGYDALYALLDGNVGGFANQNAAKNMIETGVFLDDFYRKSVQDALAS